MRHLHGAETHSAFVAYRDSRQRKDGTVTHYVRWVDPATKKQRTQKVASEEDAKFLVTVLNAHANDADAALSSARDHYKGIYSVTRMIEDHIALLTNANGYTIRRYKSNHKCHIADALGTLDASKVEYRDIVRWMQGMEAKGLASKTTANVHGLISAAFNSVVRDKRRPDNPCKGIALPKSQDTEEKATFLTQEEWRLVKAELTDPYRALFDFLILTGLRFSEATALEGRHFQEARSGQHIVKVTQAWTSPNDRFVCVLEHHEYSH